MAPTRFKKQRKSTESTSSVDVQNFPAPPQFIPAKMRTPARSPISKSPIKKQATGITMGQKQALIDNLQLEITERARKLRAQYMLQAQGLRTRIEIRVNRIPMALRKAKMGDLLLKYSEGAKRPILEKAKTSPAKLQSPSRVLAQQAQTHIHASPSARHGVKRTSDDISSTDKENEDVENPMKRVRGAPAPPARSTSKVQPSQVLSPRSANSRTLPRSPVRPAGSPGKSMLARPISPLKPLAPVPSGGAAGILTSMVVKAKGTTRAPSRKVTGQSATSGVGRGKRAAPPVVAPKIGRGRAISDSSEESSGSQNTIVRKPVAAPAAKKAPAKRTVMSTIKGMGGNKKTAAPKATTTGTATTTATATGTRVLRKRN